jgi:hypothetical protein
MTHKYKIYISLITLFASLSLSNTSLVAQNINDWENPDVNGINKETPHAFTFIAEEKAGNPFVQSLNGIWKFKWSPDPQSRPVDFYKENYLAESWNNILVLGNVGIQHTYLYKHNLSFQARFAKDYQRTGKIFHELSS